MEPWKSAAIADGPEFGKRNGEGDWPHFFPGRRLEDSNQVSRLSLVSNSTTFGNENGEGAINKWGLVRITPG